MDILLILRADNYTRTEDATIGRSLDSVANRVLSVGYL